MNAPSRLLPSRPDWSPARTRLYEAALSLFGQRGYHAVSVRDVTRTLDQRPGALYSHVESKEQLLAELIVVGLETLRDGITSAVEGAGNDPVQQLRHLVQTHVRLHAEYPALARVVNREFHSLSPGRQEEMRVLRAQSAEVLVAIIRRGVASGAFRTEEPVLAMRAIAGMGLLVSEWIEDAGDEDITHITTVFADLAVNMLRP